MKPAPTIHGMKLAPMPDCLVSSMLFFAQAPSKWFDGVTLGAAVVLTILGVVMFWHAPRHRMSVEEHTKDGEMTEDEGRRRIRFFAWCAPAATTIGLVLLVLAIYDMSQ